MISLEKIKKDPLFSILLLVIAVFAFFFRVVNYNERIYVQADNTRDVQVARYAFDNLKIPQIGQFSSAGPFFYGPWYYWFLGTISFLPLGALTHWYAMTLIYLFFIYLIYLIGKDIGGKYVGLLASLLTSVSPAQINYSFSTWNPAIVPILSLLILMFLIRLFKHAGFINIFILGFLVGLTISVHFQSILLSPALLVAAFSFRRGRFLTKILILIIGFLVPFLPLIYFDFKHNWYNFKSLFIFLAIDQYRIWVPNRWLIYVFDYWPKTWSFIVGGTRYVAGAIMALLVIFTILRLKNFSKNRFFFAVVITFALEIILFRYYRGERFQYYSLFAHPAVLLLTAWVLNQLIKVQKVLGFTFLCLVTFSTINLALNDIVERSISYPKINNVKAEIYKSYPNEKFDIYGCRYNAALVSHPLAFFMYLDGRNESGGIRIGVCNDAKAGSWIALDSTDENYSKDFWINNTTENVYRSTTEWWIDNPPSSGGDFWQFLKKNLNPKCYPHC